MNGKRNISMDKVLVDTSFLLPALGIDTDEDVLEAIRFFRLIDVYYVEYSILEAIWKILKIIPPEKIGRVERGIESISETYNLIIPSAEEYVYAYTIYHRGHRDFIDNLLYAVSYKRNISLLTIDLEFIEFLKDKGYYIENILTPKKFKAFIKELC